MVDFPESYKNEIKEIVGNGENPPLIVERIVMWICDRTAPLDEEKKS